MATTAVLCCSVEYFIPSNSECVLCSPEPLLLLFQTPCSGNKPLMGILLLRVSVRSDVVRTIIFDRVGLFGLILHVVVVGQWFNAVFVVRWLTLLYRWVYMIVVFVEAGFGAALTPPL